MSRGTTNKYLDEAERVIALAEQRVKTEKGPCSRCRYSFFSFDRLELCCDNPLVRLAAGNETRAYHKERIAECDEQRDSHSYYGSVVCGPDGTLFEPKLTFLGMGVSFWVALGVIGFVAGFFAGCNGVWT